MIVIVMKVEKRVTENTRTHLKDSFCGKNDSISIEKTEE